MFDRLGDRAIRFARPAVDARTIVERLRTWPNVVDVVVTREHVAIYYDDAPPTPLDPDRAPRTVELHAIYDGEDLPAIAAATGLSIDEVIERHASAIYTVDTMGFLPGFAYLAGVDPLLASLPRRATPRVRVPAGAIGLAMDRCGVYPSASPGGWNLVGRVTDEMYSEHGSLLHLGDRVRFVR